MGWRFLSSLLRVGSTDASLDGLTDGDQVGCSQPLNLPPEDEGERGQPTRA
jgi:hypothetical protein